MIGHHAHLEENDNFSFWRAKPGIKKKPPFLNVHALITPDQYKKIIIYRKSIISFY